MSQLQLNFSLRTSGNCKTAHLVGNWDGYKGLLPLSKDSSKVGAWKGTFRFPASVLKQGERYWYYYIIDGYHVSHDPARESVVEPTTGRKLNFIDIPAGAATTKTTSREARQSRRQSTVPAGRPLSVSEIKSPRPQRPQESQRIRQEQFQRAEIESLSSKLSAANLEDSDSEDDSDCESDLPSLTSSRASSPSSVSSVSSCCTCERFGITRAGSRVRLDCGGSRCGSEVGSDCCSESESEAEYVKRSTRRHGVVIRN